MLSAFAFEDGASGAPVVFGTEKNHLFSALALEDDLLRRMAHVDLLPPLPGSHDYGFGKLLGYAEAKFAHS
jgi:hypothetical protein